MFSVLVQHLINITKRNNSSKNKQYTKKKDLVISIAGSNFAVIVKSWLLMMKYICRRRVTLLVKIKIVLNTSSYNNK